MKKYQRKELSIALKEESLNEDKKKKDAEQHFLSITNMCHKNNLKSHT